MINILSLLKMLSQKDTDCECEVLALELMVNSRLDVKVSVRFKHKLFWFFFTTIHSLPETPNRKLRW